MTPRAVRSLIGMGIDLDVPEWCRNRGVRVRIGDRRMEINWPEVEGFPAFGLTRGREDFDEILVQHAVSAGGRLLLDTTVVAPLRDRTDRVVGVETVSDGRRRAFRAQLVVAADGASTRVAVKAGAARDTNRPVATAVRRYFHCPRRDDDYLEL